MHRQEITPGSFSYAAERFVNRDDTGEDTRLGLCHRILCLEFCGFGHALMQGTFTVTS